MFKKTISFALALILVLSIFTFSAFAAATLSLDKTNYTAGDTITVSYFGITDEMKTASAWIGIAKQGAAANGYLSSNWEYVDEGSGTIQLKAPSDSGTYEVRFYQAYAAIDTNLVRSASVVFTVGSAPVETTQLVQPTQQTPAEAVQTNTSGITVLMDGNLMSFDVPPQLINDRTMVPLRAIFEAMGAKVDWDGETQTVTGTKDNTVVVLAIGSTSPTINGKVMTIDQPGVIIDSRTLAPLRFVAEAFGGTVDWDGDTQTASIIMGSTAAPTPPVTTTPTPTPQPTPTPSPTPGGDGLWTGTWDTIDNTIGAITLNQNGNSLSGTFYSGEKLFSSGIAEGTISGSVTGNIAIVFFKYESSKGGSCPEVGEVIECKLEMSADQNEFTLREWQDEINDYKQTTPFSAERIIPSASSPTPMPTITSGPYSLVGKWFSDYGIIHTSVYFFDSDGSFIYVSIEKPDSTAVFGTVYNLKGNYSVSGETVEFTNLYGYSNDLAGWRDVPMSEIDVSAIMQNVYDIQEIMKTGVRAEVEKLINPDNPYYHQKSNHGWQNWSTKSGDIEFTDANRMKTNINGGMNEYEKMN